MGKGKRLKEARRRERAMQAAVRSWFAAEGERLAPGRETACRRCGGPTWVMLAPIPLLRCNDCDWQGLPLLRGPDSLRVPDLEGELCPVVERHDGVLEVEGRVGRVLITHDEDSVTVSTGAGQVSYAFTGHLVEATGDCARFAGQATRPPRCTCGEWWTHWLTPAEAEPLIRREAEARGVETVEFEGGAAIPGFGGRVFACAVCDEHGIVRTLGE